MQAYRLRIADGHHTQVVKVCVEPRSNCAAFLLADSSCLLVSLSSLRTYQPISIPAPCTDACFVRLQARVLAGGGSTPSGRALPVDKGASGGILTSGGESRDQHGRIAEGSRVGLGVDPCTVAAGKATPKSGHKGRVGRLVANTNGKAGYGSTRTHIFFLTAQPGKGGSCIDLHAWLCEPPSFIRANVEIDLRRSSKGSEIGNLGNDLPSRPPGRWGGARLEIPHGMMMKMVASVNVVVVYSIAGGKIWIMAAKYVGVHESPRDHGGRSFRGNSVNTGDMESELGKGRRAESGRGGEGAGNLLLMKCAVLDCNRPVYSLHVSPQHLLLGETGGARIWPLRPLIKPEKRPKDKERVKDSTNMAEENRCQTTSSSRCFQNGEPVMRVITTPSEEDSDGDKSGGTDLLRCGPAELVWNGVKKVPQVWKDQQLDTLSTSARLTEEKAPEQNGPLSNRVSASGTRLPLKNGFHEKEQSPSVHVKVETVSNGNILQSNSRVVHDQLEENGRLPGGKGMTLVNDTLKLPMAPGDSLKDEFQKVLQVTKDYIRASTLDNVQKSSGFCTNEDADHLGKRTIMESLLKAGVVPKRNGVVLHNGSGHEVLYNIEGSQSSTCGSDGVAILEANAPSDDSHAWDEKPLDSVKQHHGLGVVGPIFVPISKESQQDGLMAVKGLLQAQVVDIQAISLKKFVALDSFGDLHLLVLEDLQEQGISSHARASNPKMTLLRTSMRVSSMALLLPSVQSPPVEATCGVARKLWISDGLYSNYIAHISGDGAEEVGSEVLAPDGGHTTALPLKVSQAVFSSERVAALAAVSAETVLVVTQGSIIAYVIAGS